MSSEVKLKKIVEDAIMNIRQQTKKEVFDAIEEEFNTDHFCQECEKWCDCWIKFKEKILQGEKNE